MITSSIEHAAMLETCRFLDESGTRVTHLPVDSEGLVSSGPWRALHSNVTLVSVMAANNLVGTLQPIEELAHLTNCTARCSTPTRCRPRARFRST